MLLLRKVGIVVFYAWGAAWTARAVFDWLLGLDGVALAVPSVVVTAAGAVAGFSEARDLGPMNPSDRRDVILGFGAIVGILAAVACLFLPMPWGALAALLVAAARVLVLRRVPQAH
jgi:hypothetical protein